MGIFVAVSRQSSRPLPPVPGNTAANRPLPPTPTDHAARTPSQNVSTQNSRPPPPPPPTHYKRLSGSEGVSIKHQLVRQVKSTSKSSPVFPNVSLLASLCVDTLTEGPNRYQLSVAPDYQNLDDGSANQQSMCNRYQLSVAPDYQNLDDGSANQQSMCGASQSIPHLCVSIQVNQVQLSIHGTMLTWMKTMMIQLLRVVCTKTMSLGLPGALHPLPPSVEVGKCFFLHTKPSVHVCRS